MITIGPLESFYIVGAIFVLVMTLIAYPTLKERVHKKK
jgi:hypothetical protein